MPLIIDQMFKVIYPTRTYILFWHILVLRILTLPCLIYYIVELSDFNNLSKFLILSCLKASNSKLAKKVLVLNKILSLLV